MKNTILWSVIFALIGTQVHADVTQQTPPSPQAPSTTQNPPPITPPTTPTSQTVPASPPPTSVINCEYKIPAETKTVDQSLVITWSEKAVTQAFSFDSNNLDNQLQKLQPCFTEQGWTGFNTALQKSGNLDAIKTQKLTVSSQIDGQVVVNEAKDNQWKINLPLQVVYQNDKEKVTQLLSVDLTVGRKLTGDLGIVQMIAAPRGTATPEKQSNTENTTSETNSNATPDATTAPSSTTSPSSTTPPTPTTPTQPTSGNPSGTPTPSTPGQPTLPGN